MSTGGRSPTALSCITMDSPLPALQPLPIFFFFIFFTFPLLFIIFMFRSRRKLPYPPGPKGLPVIGNMLMVDQITHRGLAKLAKQYGGLFHLQLGVLNMVVVSTLEMAREVLQVQDNVFSNRLATVASSYLTYGRADMAFADYGPFWRQMRKICVMKLFSRRRAESWSSVREEVDSMLRIVEAKAGSPVNIGELVFSLTRNITYQAAFGSNFIEGQDEFVKILHEFSKLIGAFNIGDFIPWLSWTHARELNERLAKARGSLDGFIDKIIDDHLVKKKSKKSSADDAEADTDMVDELLNFYIEDVQKGDSNELQASINLTRDHVKAIIMDVMLGGTETVASAIEWALAELMKNPEEMKKVQQELVDVVGLDRRVHESHLDKLLYFKCTVKETLRLHPPIPLLSHAATEDSVLAGYAIPARSSVMINAWAIGRDKTVWDEPDAFKPARFLKDGAPDFKGSNFEFIPFGSGRRSCPGMQLGLYALELTVAHLLHCFTWELADGMKPSELDMSDTFGVTASKAARLVAMPSYRLQCPLFGV